MGAFYPVLGAMKLSAELGYTTLEHLEPYSPEYNPIERFWKWLKATVYGATAFETIAEVIHKVRQIIWHYNEHWLKSTIHFEFEPYQESL